MKKIIKKICRFIGRLIQFFDRIIVTPLMKLVIKITDSFKGNSKTIERMLITKQTLLIISLLIACFAFYFVDKNSNYIIDKQAEVLNNQPVTAIYNKEAYVVEGLPDTVDVYLIGSKSHVYLAKQQPNQKITIDLRELSTGTHKVSLKYNKHLKFVDYEIIPNSVTVIIHDKVSASREITYDILHRDKLNSRLDITSVELNKSEVTIKGSEKTIDEVAYVKALVDVENLVNPQAGKSNVNGVKLAAYNSNGEVVDVEILPATVDATLKLVSSSKDNVPIKIIPKGDLALGYAIDRLTSNIKTVTVYGSEDNLANVNFVPVYVDVNNISSNKDFTVNVMRPAGVRDVSVKTISVKLTVAEETQKELTITDIQPINLADNLKAFAGSKKDIQVTVIVKGSKKALDELDSKDVSAIIDLAEYKKPGEYEVNVKILGEDVRLRYTSKTKKVKIKIYEK